MNTVTHTLAQTRHIPGMNATAHASAEDESDDRWKYQITPACAAAVGDDR